MGFIFADRIEDFLGKMTGSIVSRISTDHIVPKVSSDSNLNQICSVGTFSIAVDFANYSKSQNLKPGKESCQQI